MNPLAKLCLLTILLLGAGTGAAQASAATPAEEAVRVMNDFLAAFNARDEAAWADTLLFPHVRLASQTVTVYDTREEFLAGMDLDRFAAQTGWRYSTWDDLEVIQQSDVKVHVKVRFSRFNEFDELISSFDSLYVVEQVDGRWGVRARSSFAP